MKKCFRFLTVSLLCAACLLLVCAAQIFNPLTPPSDEAELETNNRARSARLRAAEKIRMSVYDD